MNEYQYLRSLTFWRYQAQREETYALFWELHESAMNKGDYDRAILLKASHKAAQEKLFSECARAEQIISWLALDAELRQDKLSYPDIFELCMNKLKRE